MRRYSLIIIDMQNLFEASKKRKLIKNCKKEIKKAIDNNFNIIFLEYNGNGKTRKALTKLTNNYKRTFTITKNMANGSGDLIKLINKKRLAKKRFRVCGVETNCCVFDTVLGLKKMLKPEITIIKNACSASDLDGHSQGLFYLNQLGCKFEEV